MLSIVRIFCDLFVRIAPRRLRGILRAAKGNDTFERYRKEHVSHLTKEIRHFSDNLVQNGPFSGMILSSDESWGDFGSKLLGTYEADLFDTFEDIVMHSVDVIIDVGAAEGYYAVGLGLRIPSCPIYAYDISNAAQNACRVNLEINGLSFRSTVSGLCTVETLIDLASRFQRPLVFLDCEGAELNLLRGAKHALMNTRLIVECHDFVNAGTTDEIMSCFNESHSIRLVKQGSRNPHDIPLIRNWSETDKWLIISETRPVSMHWLDMTPLNRSGHVSGAEFGSRPNEQSA